MTGSPGINEATLPNALQRGLAAIRARLIPDAPVVAIEGNFVYVAVGTLTKGASRPSDGAALGDAELPARYTQDNARLFARVARNFPSAESYGVLTVPFLTRGDGAKIPWQHVSHGSAQPLAAALDVTGVGFWSWDWRGMPARQGEDLVAIVEWARKCVREGAQ